MPEKYDIPYLEMFLNTEALFTQNGDHMKSDEVIGRSYQENGEPVGIYIRNTIINTRVYAIMLLYGTIQKYSEMALQRIFIYKWTIKATCIRW